MSKAKNHNSSTSFDGLLRASKGREIKKLLNYYFGGLLRATKASEECKHIKLGKPNASTSDISCLVDHK